MTTARMAGCRVIAVANQKGGVAKSATSVNLSAALARMGYFTLLALKETKRKKLTKRDIEESIPGGRDLFANAWKELKELGYIRLHATACPHGWIYEIEPVMNPNPDSPHTIYYNSSGIITKMIFRDGREIRGNGF